MSSLLNRITETFNTAVQNHFVNIGNKTAIVPHVTSPEKLKIPTILLYSNGFTSEPTGIGGVDESGAEKSENFSGDGSQTIFKLSENLFKPIRRITISNFEKRLDKTLKEGTDFRVDYQKNLLEFNSPPPKGDKNLLVRYGTANDLKEVKVLKIDSKFFIDSWAGNLLECNILIEEAIKAIMLYEKEFTLAGLKVSPPKMETLDVTNLQIQGVGRRAIYSVETDLIAEKPVMESGIIRGVKIQDKNIEELGS